MDSKENVREGVRRIWIVCCIVLTFVIFSNFLLKVTNPNISATTIFLIGILLAAPLAGFLVYHFGWLLGWPVFEWVYDGFLGKQKID